jgi:hypothetical protein
MGTCKGPTCRARIRFVRLLPNLETHPVEWEPAADGTIGIVQPAADGKMAQAAVLSKARRQSWTGDLYRTHFATCPDAEWFRRQP